MPNKIKRFSEKLRANPFWANLFKNSFWAFLGDSGASVINLVTSIALVHYIGSENYGIFLLGQSYMLIMDVLLNVQSWKGVIQFGQASIVKKDYKSLHGYVKLGFILDASTAIVGGVVAVFTVGAIGRLFGWSEQLVVCAQISSYTIFSNISGTATAILRMLNKFNWVAIQKMLSATIKLAALVFLLHYHPNMSLANAASIYVIGDIIGNLLLVVFAAYHYNKKYGLMKAIHSKPPRQSKKFLTFTLWGTLSEIVDVPVNYLDGFIISVLGPTYVAILKIFRQFVNILQKAMSPIQQSIMPQFSEMSASNKKKEAFDAVQKIHRFVMKYGLPLALLVGLSSPIWLNILYGQIYADYWYVLTLYMVIQTIALSYTTIHPYFLSLGKSKASAFYTGLSNVIYLVVAYILVNLIGIIGIVLAFGVQCTIVIYLKYRNIKKELANA